MKTCNHCKKDKPVEDFGKDKYSKDGKNPKCKACCCEFQEARKEAKRVYDAEYRQKNNEYLRKRDRERYQKNPEAARLYKLLVKFGITADDEKRMLEEQNHVCAICEKPEWVKVRGKVKRLAVDHRHSDKKVRGLLCNNCNRAFGLLFESAYIIYRMFLYAIKHGGSLD